MLRGSPNSRALFSRTCGRQLCSFGTSSVPSRVSWSRFPSTSTRPGSDTVATQRMRFEHHDSCLGFPQPVTGSTRQAPATLFQGEMVDRHPRTCVMIFLRSLLNVSLVAALQIGRGPQASADSHLRAAATGPPRRLSSTRHRTSARPRLAPCLTGAVSALVGVHTATREPFFT
jgi:hypothetical protein